MKKKDSNKVCAVLITWNIGEGLQHNVDAVAFQVDKIVIVDNGSGRQTLAAIDKLRKKNPAKTDVIKNRSNLGIATAQNQGILYARKNGFDWVLLLDHDSTPSKNMVENMFKELDSCRNKEKIGIIAPHIKDRNVSRPCYYITARNSLFFKKTGFAHHNAIQGVLAVIASGSLIRLSVIKEIGCLKEQLFIDHVDTEFCLRLVNHGYMIMAVNNAVLEHSLGQIQVHSLFGRKVNVTNHSAQRRYTIFRNRLFVWRAYGLKAPGFIAFDFLAAVFELVKLILFEKQKKNKLYFVIKGLYAGLSRLEPSKGNHLDLIRNL